MVSLNADEQATRSIHAIQSPVVMMENLSKLHYENHIIGWWHEQTEPPIRA